jgi:hypothetical protein
VGVECCVESGRERRGEEEFWGDAKEARKRRGWALFWNIFIISQLARENRGPDHLRTCHGCREILIWKRRIKTPGTRAGKLDGAAEREPKGAERWRVEEGGAEWGNTMNKREPMETPDGMGDGRIDRERSAREWGKEVGQVADGAKRWPERGMGWG